MRRIHRLFSLSLLLTLTLGLVSLPALADLQDQGGTEEMKHALSAYCAALAELNTEVWKDFMAAYVSDAFGLMGFNKITQDNAKEFLDKSEKVINALCDKDAADALLEETKNELSAEVIEELKSSWKNNFAEFIKDSVPYGDRILEGAKVYKKAKAGYDEWERLINTGLNGSDMEKAQVLYSEFQSSINDLNSILNEIGS